jgi:hypothetical protein
LREIKKSRFRCSNIEAAHFSTHLEMRENKMITENDDLTEQERELIAQWEEQQDALNAPSAWEYSQFF